jgi:adenylate cyclase
VQNGLIERNAGGLPPESRVEFRVGIHLSVVEEGDSDLMGDGVNIAARLEGIAAPGAICLSEDAVSPGEARLDPAVTDLGPTQLKNIANIAEPIPRLFAANRPPVREKRPEPKRRTSLALSALGFAALVTLVRSQRSGANRPSG